MSRYVLADASVVTAAWRRRQRNTAGRGASTAASSSVCWSARLMTTWFRRDAARTRFATSARLHCSEDGVFLCPACDAPPGAQRRRGCTSCRDGLLCHRGPTLANAGERRGQQYTVHWLLGLVR